MPTTALQSRDVYDAVGAGIIVTVLAILLVLATFALAWLRPDQGHGVERFGSWDGSRNKKKKQKGKRRERFDGSESDGSASDDDAGAGTPFPVPRGGAASDGYDAFREGFVDDEYMEDFAKAGPYRLVLLHMNGCGHCVRFMPTWREFKARHEDAYRTTYGLAIEDYEANEARDLFPSVRSFPTVVLADGATIVATYEGQRTSEALDAWVRERMAGLGKRG